MIAPASLRAVDDPVDVAIVGGGPVGLLLGCLLAIDGIAPVVLERRAGGSSPPRAIGIHPPGLAALDAVGIGDAVRAAAAPIRRGVARSGERGLGEIAFRAPICSLPQDRTEALLRARLQELAPDALRCGVEVVEVVEVGGGGAGGENVVELVTMTGPSRVPGRVTARYAVGADGVRSRVRSAIGGRWMARPGTARYAMVDTAGAAGDPPDAPDAALIRLEPAGVVESFPLADGGRRWVVRIDDGEEPVTAEAFADLVMVRTGVRVDPASAGPPSVFLARQHLAERFAAARLVLVGDAAHEVSPIGGQGMSLGWLDALQLAPVLSEALAAGAAAHPFGRYQRLRRTAAARAMRRAAFNMAMGGPATGVRLRWRGALVRLLARPPLSAVLTAAFTMRGL